MYIIPQLDAQLEYLTRSSISVKTKKQATSQKGLENDYYIDRISKRKVKS